MRHLGEMKQYNHYYGIVSLNCARYEGDSKLLVLGIRDESGQLLADHVWVDFADRGPLRIGDDDMVIEFDAEPYRYIRGIRNRHAEGPLSSDFGLRGGRNVRILNG